MEPPGASLVPLTAEEEGRRTLRGYRLLGFIGSGTFAEVSKYLKLDTNEVVAVKRLKKDTYKSGVNLGAIKELQALQELDHPNVLAVRLARQVPHPVRQVHGRVAARHHVPPPRFGRALPHTRAAAGHVRARRPRPPGAGVLRGGPDGRHQGQVRCAG